MEEGAPGRAGAVLQHVSAEHRIFEEAEYLTQKPSSDSLSNSSIQRFGCSLGIAATASWKSFANSKIMAQAPHRGNRPPVSQAPQSTSDGPPIRPLRGLEGRLGRIRIAISARVTRCVCKDMRRPSGAGHAMAPAVVAGVSPHYRHWAGGMFCLASSRMRRISSMALVREVSACQPLASSRSSNSRSNASVLLTMLGACRVKIVCR